MSALVEYGDSEEEEEQPVALQPQQEKQAPKPTAPAAQPPPVQAAGSSEVRVGPAIQAPPPIDAIEIEGKVLASIDKLVRMRRKGLSINEYIMKSPQFQNPYCLEKIMEVFDIAPYSSNYPATDFDPDALAVWEAPRFQRLVHEKTQHPSSPPVKSPTQPIQKRPRSPSPAASVLTSSSGIRTDAPGPSSHGVDGFERKAQKWDVRPHRHRHRESSLER